MILLDTHIWVRWLNADPHLTAARLQLLDAHQADGLGISPISCWEVAMLARLNRIELAMPPQQWVDDALTHPGLIVLELTPRIAVDSVLLPDWQHRDPADRIIVATARAYGCPIVTDDARIRAYPHVTTL